MSAPELLQPDWPALPGLRAVFTLRAGGVSAAPYDSFNLAAHVGDAPAAVAENRRRLATHLQLPVEPLWLQQRHSAVVFEADGARPLVPPAADAAVTRRAGQVLAVQVADCLPVLFARRDVSAVAVAHAGWRGLAAGVLENTVAALGGSAASLQAWLGPAIGAAHFEVGDEVRSALCGADRGAQSAFLRNARGRWQCDLHALAQRRLAALGVAAIHGPVRDTFAQAQAYYSYRRDGVTGRMAALLWIDRG